MQPSSGNPHAWLRTSCCATALVLVFATLHPVAYGHGDNETRHERTESDNLETENRCNGDFVRGKGTVHTVSQEKRKGDDVETRSRTMEQGEGVATLGPGIGTRYTWKEDRVLVMRSGPNRPQRVVSRHDERIIAHSQFVPSMFATFEMRINNGEPPEFKRNRCRCKRDDTNTATCTAEP